MRTLILTLILCSSFIGFSQNCITGTIYNNGVLPVSGARLYIQELNKVYESDSSGSFTICLEKPGTYVIQIAKEGHSSHSETVVFSEKSQKLTFDVSTGIYCGVESVTIIGIAQMLRETPSNISSLSSLEMRDAGALSLSDGISKIPGVSQLTTGVGISKPVIRGLFGNRIQTVMLGQRFDNQQWQDEHGLGLSDIGVDHVEIIKGAASLLYGSEAMGGVLNIIEEKPSKFGKISTDVSTRFFTNTFGNATDIGVKGATPKYNWRIRGGIESHADYSDGSNNRVLNSRFGGYYFKGSFGFSKRNWISQNDYMFSSNNFGFLMEASLANLTIDNRLSRNFDMPHHSVFLHVLSSQNTILLKSSKLKWTIGSQINDRQEQEGGNKISLNMILDSYSNNLLWIKNLGEKFEMNFGTQQMFQRNRNIGSRTIVPDANLFETSAFTYLKLKQKYFSIESGLRYSLKNIQTYQTGTINIGLENPGNTVLPFNKLYNSLTGSVGISIFDSKHWNVKSNFSSGFRAGNLAELSSNGLHEGSLRYEVGNINLKTEQNFCMDLLVGYESKSFSFSSSVYVNRFLNYIYLSPTSDEYIGFQIFRYIQKNATLKGTESTLEFHPTRIKWLQLKSSHSIVIGTTDDGEYLPFIPAQKINSEIKFILPEKGKLSNSFVRFGYDYIFKQDRPGQFETATADYGLFNAGLGTSIKMKTMNLKISITGTNLLNNTYYDHLSRLKYFNLYNMGRNIVLNFKFTF